MSSTRLPVPPEPTAEAAVEAVDAPAPRRRREVKGLHPFTPGRIRAQRAAVLFITLVPLLGLAGAVVLLWGQALAWSDVVAFVVMYSITCLGVTVGFHRMLTHASFDAKPWVKVFWASLGSMAVEGPVIEWVADHRRHHAHSDEEGDPHSPHLAEGEGFGAMVRGMWHAHVGWLFKTSGTTHEKWAPDLLKQPGIVRVNSLFVPFVALSLLLPALIGFALTGTAMGALSAFLWGGLVRMLVLHHTTWSINSICHVFGKRPYDSGDQSTNNWPLAILSFGESWHNNHHAFPSSAVHGLERHQIDLTALVIRGMERVGLVTNVRTPSPGALERKRRADA